MITHLQAEWEFRWIDWRRIQNLPGDSVSVPGITRRHITIPLWIETNGIICCGFILSAPSNHLFLLSLQVSSHVSSGVMRVGDILNVFLIWHFAPLNKKPLFSSDFSLQRRRCLLAVLMSMVQHRMFEGQREFLFPPFWKIAVALNETTLTKKALGSSKRCPVTMLEDFGAKFLCRFTEMPFSFQVQNSTTLLPVGKRTDGFPRHFHFFRHGFQEQHKILT